MSSSNNTAKSHYRLWCFFESIVAESRLRFKNFGKYSIEEWEKIVALNILVLRLFCGALRSRRELQLELAAETVQRMWQNVVRPAQATTWLPTCICSMSYLQSNHQCNRLHCTRLERIIPNASGRTWRVPKINGFQNWDEDRWDILFDSVDNQHSQCWNATQLFS